MASREEIQAQLNGKAHWNATDWEMREWLQSKFHIDGDDADSMIKEAMREKANTIRKRSIFWASLALIVAVPLLGLAWFGWLAEGRRTTAWAMILGSAGLCCLGYAGKNLFQCLSGKSDVAIDA